MDRERFAQAEREFFYLKGQLATERISREQFDAALVRLSLKDSSGRAWKLDAESGKWLVQQGEEWVPGDPNAPQPANGTATTTQRSSNWIPLAAIGCLVFLCVVGLGTGAVLAGTGILKVELNPFKQSMPTTVAVLSTATPARTATPTATASRAVPAATETPSPVPTEPFPTVLSTQSTPETFLARDADFTVGCDLFEGDSEVRKYGCENGEYVMLHKQNLTGYVLYDVPYDDGIIEAEGYWVSGEGKREYGIVFRANSEGTLYYVFTVTQDGRYNVALFKDKKYTDLIPYTSSPIVNTGTIPNRFKVVARGSQFDFYLNDQSVGSVNNDVIASGDVGLFLYNDQPNVTVAFDQLTVSTFSPPTPTPTAGAETATPQAVAPGVYISGLRTSSAAPKRGQPVTFSASFLNSTGKTQGYRWIVEIWEQDTSKKNPYGQANGIQQDIPIGTHELVSGDTWKVAGGGPCLPFRARVVYLDDESRRIPFKRPNGTELWVPFQVCP